MNGRAGTPVTPIVVGLGDRDAADAAIVGAKAANLARCAFHGLPTLPGFVITTRATTELAGDEAHSDTHSEIEDTIAAAWSDLVRSHGGSVVVRSSSTAEDLEASSMAGQFVSVLDVRGRNEFLDAVDAVSRSATRGGRADPRPMAVLVQPQLDIVVGGVLFGADPVTGDRRHVVVEAVPARVDDLVGGTATASHYVLNRRGRLLSSTNVAAAPRLSRRLRRRLARLSRLAERALGSAQDVEWAVDRGGRLWLLQSRPITAIAERAVSGRLYAPGPVAETFPSSLRTLEEELWLDPLRLGIERAIRATGAVSDDELASSPIVLSVHGRPAIDLGLTGIVEGRPSVQQRIDPRRILRRLSTAWRVGRLRVAFPQLADDVLDAVDTDLASIGPIDELDDVVVLELVRRARRELATVHQYEVLAGMLEPANPRDVPSSSVPVLALAALHEVRRRGWTDAEAMERAPMLLALSPPTWTPPSLPTDVGHDVPEPTGPCSHREALRLRARWLQELLAVAARTLGDRLAQAGRIDHRDLVRELTIDELAALVTSGAVPGDLAERTATPEGPPLPVRFRLGASGSVIAVHVDHPHRSGRDVAGLPAVAGRAIGTVRHDLAPGSPRGGHVLVVEHLDPALAPLLPSVEALVSETGSALSHLAIVAREIGVPTVVGVADARRRFPPGTCVIVDGALGDVQETAQAQEVAP